MPFLPYPSVRALLISTSNCRAHWVIALNNLHTVIFANLEGDTLHWSRDSPSNVLFSVGFYRALFSPGIEQLKCCLYLPEHLMNWEWPCRCAEWVWWVIWHYQRGGYIINVSTRGVTLDKLADHLYEAQLACGCQSGHDFLDD